jgi:hypothetical protein
MVLWDPFHGDNESAETAFIACGKLAIFWGHLELTIEALVITLRNRQKAPAVNGVFVGFPVSFQKKKSEIRDRMKVDIIYHDIRDRISSMLGEATIIHNVRVIALHSVCQGVNIDGDLMFGQSDQKRGVSYTPKTLSFSEIDRASTRVRTLQAEFEDVSREMRQRWLARDAPPFVPSNPPPSQ